MTSAFWHGLYPGYFVSFFHYMLYLQINQELFRIKSKNKGFKSLWDKFRIDTIENMIGNYVFLYFGVYFHLMTWDKIQIVLLSTYLIPFFILYASYFIIKKTTLIKNIKI